MWLEKVHSIITSNHMFGRAIDKLPECIFENFEIARVKQGTWYVRLRIRGLDMLVFRKILRTYLMDDPLQ